MNRADVFVKTMTAQKMTDAEAKAFLKDSYSSHGEAIWEQEVPDELAGELGTWLMSAKTIKGWHNTCDLIIEKHRRKEQPPVEPLFGGISPDDDEFAQLIKELEATVKNI